LEFIRYGLVLQASRLDPVMGLSVLAWRLSANVPQLNDDPIALFSPNDWLCPIIIYVGLGMYAAFYPPTNPARWA